MAGLALQQPRFLAQPACYCSETLPGKKENGVLAHDHANSGIQISQEAYQQLSALIGVMPRWSQLQNYVNDMRDQMDHISQLKYTECKCVRS